MSVLLADPGLLVTPPSEALVLSQEVIYAGIGLFMGASAETPTLGLRDESQRDGLFVSNTDTSVAREGSTIPGYALTKGMRVLTLVDNKVMAFRNIVE